MAAPALLSLAAAVSEAELTSPAVGASSDCVLADLAEGETKQLGHLVNSESVFEAEASPVSERGLATRGQRDSTARSGGRPRPRPSDNSDCVLAESAEVGTVPLAEEAAIQSEAGVTSPVPEWVSEKLFVNSIRRKEGIGVKKAVSQGFYEIEREALYEETLRKRAAKKAASEENLRRRRLKTRQKSCL